MGHRVLGVGQVLDKNYPVIDLPEYWVDRLGQLSKPFTLLVSGKPKNGKTNFLMQVSKMLCNQGNTVLYNSCEEGDSKTIQDAFIRQGMDEVKGKFFLGDNLSFNDMCDYLDKPRRPNTVIIDSLDYMHLTQQQYKKMVARFGKRKNIIVVCWGDETGKDFMEPDDYHARKIKYMVGGLVLVKNFIATSRGRYGSTIPHVIWEEGAKKSLTKKQAVTLSLF